MTPLLSPRGRSCTTTTFQAVNQSSVPRSELNQSSIPAAMAKRHAPIWAPRVSPKGNRRHPPLAQKRHSSVFATIAPSQKRSDDAGDLRVPGPAPGTRNGRDRPEKAAGKADGAGRAGCPDEPSNAAGGLLRATPKGRAAFWPGRRRSGGHDAVCIAPPPPPSPSQKTLPPGRCGGPGRGPRGGAGGKKHDRGQGAGGRAGGL